MSTVRIAVALSGGVDSAVAALLLFRCAPSLRDVKALCRAPCPPPLSELRDAVERCRPFAEWISPVTPLRGPMEKKRKKDKDNDKDDDDEEEDNDDNKAVSYVPVFMRNWSDGDGGALCEASERDCRDATDVARRIGLLRDDEGLPLRDLGASYIETCFNPMLCAFARGDTLNADILCNAEVKFRALLDALRSDGIDLLATGHYARAVRRGFGFGFGFGSVVARPFTAGNDLNDQTHFLSRLTARQVTRALFPLGHAFAQKADVRALAHRCGLFPVAGKKTSTGLCFVAQRQSTKKFGAFLGAFIPPDRNEKRRLREAAARTVFVDAESGEEIKAERLSLPRHCAGEEEEIKENKENKEEEEEDDDLLPAHALTIGQSLRFKEGPSTAAATRGRRMYVLSKETFAVTGDNNSSDSSDDSSDESLRQRYLRTVRLVPRWDHPLFYRREVALRDVMLAGPTGALPRVSSNGGELRMRCRCAARHQDEPRPATLFFAATDVEGDGLFVPRAAVVFDEAVRAPTAGQAVVAYAELEAGGPPNADWFVAASGWIV